MPKDTDENDTARAGTGETPDSGANGEPSSSGFDAQTPGYGDKEWPIRRSTRPSLDTLQSDQRKVIYTGEPARVPPLKPIVDGFQTRRELIEWYQAATVRTFGHLADELPPHDLERDLALVDALTEERPHDRDGDKWLHTRVIEVLVLPACGTAYRHLRDKSAERTATTKYADDEEDWESIDPEAEHHIGMRPGYSRLDAEQAEVLAELWGGFNSRNEIGEWLHSLHPATYGTYGADDAREILSDQYGLEQFQADTSEGRILRERFAIAELLPQFAEAARRLRASEQSETEPDNTWRDG